MRKQKWERGGEEERGEGREERRERRKRKRPFSIALAFSPEAEPRRPFFLSRENISTTPDPSSFSVSSMAWWEEETIVNRSHCCKTGNATPRKGFRACGTNGRNLFLSRHTCEDLSLVRLVHPVKWAKLLSPSKQTKQANKSYKGTP